MAIDQNAPHHVAIIMDGNGRWAQQHRLPRLEGHRRGARVARQVVQWAADSGVKQLSLFAFSTENWARPETEVRGLMALLATLLPKQLANMQKQGVRLRTLGHIDALPERAKQAVIRAVQETRDNQGIELILCLNYGGQQEILEGVRRAALWAATQSDPEQALANMDTTAFRKFLWCGGLSPVDLLIRTGGEKRISNFFLWDVAYTELYYCDKLWPDFSLQDFQLALDDFEHRERRFGQTSEQVRA